MADPIIIAFDASTFSAFQKCPRYYKFRYIESWVNKEGKPNSLEAGSIAHFVLEHFRKALLAGKDRATAIQIGLDAGREYLHEYRESNIFMLEKEHEGVKNTPLENEKRGQTIIIGSNYVFETMLQYFDFYRNESWTLLGAEETRGKIIFEGEDIVVLWKAKFDALVDADLGVMPVDGKTMKQRRDNIRLNNQFRGQGVITNSRSIIVDKIGFQTTLKPEEKFLREVISYAPDAYSEWMNDTVPTWARLFIAFSEADYWPENPNGCETKFGKCEFLKVCEADRNMRGEEVKLYFKKGKPWDIGND